MFQYFKEPWTYFSGLVPSVVNHVRSSLGTLCMMINLAIFPWFLPHIITLGLGCTQDDAIVQGAEWLQLGFPDLPRSALQNAGLARGGSWRIVDVFVVHARE